MTLIYLTNNNLGNYRFVPHTVDDLIRIPIGAENMNAPFNFKYLDKMADTNRGGTVMNQDQLMGDYYVEQYKRFESLYNSYEKSVNRNAVFDLIEERGKFYSLDKGNKVQINEGILDFYIDYGADNYAKYKDYVGQVGVLHDITKDTKPTKVSSLYLHTVKYGDEELTFTSTMLDKI